MSWSLLGHGSAGFADGSGGHPLTIGAPSAGDLDVLTANSATVVASPAGWSLAVSRVGGQGAYIWYRVAAGGEGSQVTLTTSGDFNTAATWSRWSGASALDVAVEAHVDGSGDVVSPPVSTGTLAGAAELVLMLAALHVGTPAVNVVWSAGYTALDAASCTTSGGGEVTGLTGYRTDAGTAAETPSVSWTNTAVNRYALVVAFKPSGAPPVRNVDLVVGVPQTKWLTAQPDAKWRTGTPAGKWAAGRPGV